MGRAGLGPVCLLMRTSQHLHFHLHESSSLHLGTHAREGDRGCYIKMGECPNWSTALGIAKNKAACGPSGIRESCPKCQLPCGYSRCCRGVLEVIGQVRHGPLSRPARRRGTLVLLLLCGLVLLFDCQPTGRRECRSNSDCAAGETCYAWQGSGCGPWSRTSCVVVCRTNSDCPRGQSCMRWNHGPDVPVCSPIPPRDFATLPSADGGQVLP